MPADPSPAQSEASRRNGAQGQGPATAEGKASSALNATSHGLCGALRLRPDEVVAFERIHADLLRLYRPSGAAMAEVVLELARIALRERRLHELDMVAMMVVTDPIADQDEAPPVRLPSIATLLRYRARIERDRRAAWAQIAQLRALEGVAAPSPSELEAIQSQAIGDRFALGFGGRIEPEPEPDAGRSASPIANRHERRRREALERKRALVA